MSNFPGQPAYMVDPRWQPIGRLTASADIQQDPLRRLWNVTVLLRRTPDMETIQGEDVEAQLLDRSGGSFPQQSRPTGLLPEVSEEMLIEADARFQFRSSRKMPARLRVTFQQQSIEFRLTRRKLGKEAED